jgi:hypothetical protein
MVTKIMDNLQQQQLLLKHTHTQRINVKNDVLCMILTVHSDDVLNSAKGLALRSRHRVILLRYTLNVYIQFR